MPNFISDRVYQIVLGGGEKFHPVTNAVGTNYHSHASVDSGSNPNGIAHYADTDQPVVEITADVSNEFRSWGAVILSNNTNFTGALGDTLFTIEPADNIAPGATRNDTVSPNTVEITSTDHSTWEFFDPNWNIVSAQLRSVANDVSHTTQEDTNKVITLGEGATIVSGPSSGSGSMSISGGVYTYSPHSNFYGSDSFTYKFVETETGIDDSDTKTVTVTVNSVNDAPVANAESFTTYEDTAIEITLSASDVDGDALTFSIVDQPINGTLSGNYGTTGKVTYTPNANYNGSDSFTFKVNDGTADSEAKTISLTVMAVNDAPVANAESFTTSEDTAIEITLTASDIEGDGLTYEIFSGPSHGTLSTITDTNKVTYTPNANFNGSDSFTFEVNDGTTYSEAKTISLTVTPVNDAPVANAESFTTYEDTAIEITLSASDVDGDALTFSIVDQPINGTLSGNYGTTGKVTYTPNANYNGSDSFTFKVNDGTADSEAKTISLTVMAVNDAPVANAESFTTSEDTAIEITLTASDIEGDGLTYEIFSGPSHGTLSTITDTNKVTYTPNANFNGSDSFTFEVNDGTTYSEAKTISLTVTPVNDAPVANAESFTTNEDTAIEITLSASDVDGDALTFSIVDQPINGTLSGNYGTTGKVTYTPNANYNGSDSFTFKVNDGTADSEAKTISLTVTPVEDAPVANAESFTTSEDTAIEITLSASDVDGDALTYSIVSGPSHGNLSTITDTNKVTYTPNANYNGSDYFTFKVNDGTADSEAKTISLTVTPVNDAPVANAESFTTNEDTAIEITLSASDVDGDALTYSIVSGPSNGNLSTITDTNKVTYTPNANYNGSDSFTFKVNDGTADSEAKTISLTVTPVNDAPTGSVSIAGTPTVSHVLTASNDLADEDGPNSLVVSYQWKRDGVAITGATASTYTLMTADASENIKVTATYTDAQGNSHSVDSATQAISAASVTVTGTPQEDETLAVSTDLQGSLSYEWTRGDDSAVISTAATYTLVQADVDSTITCEVSTDISGVATVSGTSGTVANVDDAPTGSVSITGTPTVSHVLTASNDLADEDGPNSLVVSYQWKRDGFGIYDANASEYTLVAVDVGKNIKVTATYADAQGNSHSVDSATQAISAASVTVTGTPQEDEILGVSTTLQGTLSYKWTRGASTDAISTAATYTLVQADVDSTIKCAVSTDISGVGGVFGTSGTVANVDDAPTGSVSITGTPTVSHVLTASNDLADEDGPNSLVVSYQWKRDGVAITGATASTYTLMTADASENIKVTASYTDAQGNSHSVDSATQAISAASVTVTGTPQEDETLAVSTDLQGSLSYEWTRGDDSAVISTAATYTLVQADVDSTITCEVSTDISGVATVSGTSGTVANVNDKPIASGFVVHVNEDTAIEITLLASDVDGDALTYSIVSGTSNGNLSTITDTNKVTYTPNANYNGPDSFTFNVYDGTEYSDAEIIYLSVNAVNDLPAFTTTPPTVATEDVEYTYTIRASDVDDGDYYVSSHGDSLVISVPTKPAWLNFYTNVPPTDGDYGYQYSGDHHHLDMEYNYVYGEPVDLRTWQPTITISNNGQNLYVSGLQPDNFYGAQLSFTRINNGDSFTNSHNGQKTTDLPIVYEMIRPSEGGVSSLRDGLHQLTISSNGDIQMHTWWSYSWRNGVSDLSNNITTFRNMNPSFTFETADTVLKGTPLQANVGTGGNSVTLRATDNDGAFAEQSFTINVGNTNDAPTIDSVAIEAVDEDAAYSYTVSASDVDGGDTVTLSCPTKPAWLTFNAGTGVLSGTPLNANVGTGGNSVTLRATDNDGAFAEQSFTITVSNTNDAPTGLVVTGTPTLSYQLTAEVSGLSDEDGLPPKSYTQLGADIDGEAQYDYSGVSVSLSADGTIVAIGAIQNDGNGDNSGHVRVYQFASGAWTKLGQDIDGELGGDNSGYSVSMSADGTIVAIGAIQNDGNGDNSGHVRVYQFASGAWTKLGQDIDGELGGDNSGYSVSMSADGTIVAIGARFNDGNGANAGHVRVYQFTSGAWTKLGQDIDGEAADDRSGVSVSMSADGTIVAIGAPKNDGNGANAGHVRVYQFTSGAWTKLGQDIDGEVAGDNSGVSVSMSADGTIVAIGATLNDGDSADEGHVRVYQFASGAWTQLGQDIDGEAAGNRSGYSVSLSADGTIVAIGATRNDGNGAGSGHVRVYQFASGAWTQLLSDIDGEAAGDRSGWSVSLSADGTIVAIGSVYNDGNGAGSGHVRVFNLNDDPFAYQWLRDGADITGATSSTYSLVDADVGETVSLRLSYTDAQGTAEVPVSSPTIAISDSGTTPTISGDAIIGNVLTAASGLRGTLVYTWLRDGADIANSNASSYTLVAADAGKAMSVRVSTDIASIAARTSDPTANVVYTPNVQNVVFSSTTNSVSGSFEIDAAQHSEPVTSVTLHIDGVEHSSSHFRVRRTGKYSYSFEAKTASKASSIQIVAGEYGTHSEAAVQYDSSSTIEVDTSTRTSAESDIANAKVSVGASNNQRDIARASIASAMKQMKPKIPKNISKSLRKQFKNEVTLFSNRETFEPHKEMDFSRQTKVALGQSGQEKREMNRTIGTSSFVVERAIDVDAAGVKSTKKRSFKTDVYEVSVTSGQSQKLSGFQENHITLLVEGTGNARYLTQLKADDGVSKLPSRGANKYMSYSSDLTALLSASTEKSVNFVLIGDDISTLAVANHSSSFTSASWFSEYIEHHTDSTWDTDASVKALEMGEYIRDNFVSESILKDAGGTEIEYEIDYEYSSSTHTLSMSWNTFGDTAAVSHELYANIPSASQVTAQIQQAYTNPELTDVTDSTNVVVISDANDALVGFTATMECVFHVTAANATLNVESGAAITVGADCIFVFDHGVAPGATFQVMTVAADGSTLNAGSAKWYRLPQNTAFDSNNIAAYRSSAASTPISSAGLLTLNTPPSGSVSISGSVEEGATISVDTSLITDAEQTVAELTFTYQWQMSAGTSNENFGDIANETNASYTIASDQSEVGRYIACVVTVNDGLVDYVATTPAQGIGNVNDAPTGLVVSGTPTLSYQLTADVSTLSDDDGLPDAGTFTYQWLRDGADITGATSSTYSLVDADVGETVSLRLSYTDAQGTAEAPVSSPTIAISDSGMTPTISGDAIEGEVLTTTSGLQGTLVYTWLRDGADIANSNASSYTLVAADAGKAITVRVSVESTEYVNAGFGSSAEYESAKQVYGNDVIRLNETDANGVITFTVNGQSVEKDELSNVLIGTDVQFIASPYYTAWWDTWYEKNWYELEKFSFETPTNVTEIPSSYFRVSALKLQSMHIPNGITSIGRSAFRETVRLFQHNIPSSVTSIGDGAFYGFKGNQINIPSSVTSIGEEAFKESTFLIDIDLSENLESIGQGAFDKSLILANSDYGGYISYVVNKQFVIPATVTQIGNNALRFTALKYIQNNSSIVLDSTHVHPYHFLIHIHLGEQLIQQGDTLENAAARVAQEYINLPQIPGLGPRHIYAGVAAGFSMYRFGGSVEQAKLAASNGLLAVNSSDTANALLVSQFIEASIAFWNRDVQDGIAPTLSDAVAAGFSTVSDYETAKQTYGNDIIRLNETDANGELQCSINGTAITFAVNVLVGSDVVSIPHGGQSSPWHGVRKISFETPSSLTTIGSDAFNTQYGGAKFETLNNLPNSLLTIGDRAFYKNYYLKTITIPSNVTSIGELAFSKCITLAEFEFTLPSSITHIGQNAFDFEDFSAWGGFHINIPSSVSSTNGITGTSEHITVTIVPNVVPGTSSGTTTTSAIAPRTSDPTANVVYTPNVQNVVFSSTTNRVSGSFEIDAAQHSEPVTSVTLHIDGVEHSSSHVRVSRTGKYSYSFEAKTASKASSIQIVAGEYGTHSEAAVQYDSSSTIEVDTSTRTSAESDIANAMVLDGALQPERDIARASIASAMKQMKPKIPKNISKSLRKQFKNEVTLFSNRETFEPHKEMDFSRQTKVALGQSGQEKREMKRTIGTSSFVVERAIDVDAAGVKSTKKRSFKTDVYEVSVTSGQSHKLSGFQENHMTLLVEGTGNARYLTQLKADDGVSKLPSRGANKYMSYSSDLTALLSASTEKSVNFVLIGDDISTLAVANHSSSFTSASWFSEYIEHHTDSTWDTDASVKALEMGEYIRDNFVSESVLKDAGGTEIEYEIDYEYSSSTHTLSMSWNTFGDTAAVSHELYANIPSASQVTAQIQQAYTNPELTDVTDSTNVVVISDANDALVGFTATMECVFHVTAANATLNVESGAAITVGADCIFVFDHGVAPGATFQVMTVAADGSTLNAGSAKWYRLPQNTAFDSNNIAAYRNLAASTPISSAGLLTLNTPPSGSVSISGSVEEGATISVDTSLITDAEQTVAELTFTYQWQMSAGTSNENFGDIANEKDASYTIASDQSEVGRYIACVVTVNDGLVDYVATTPAQEIGNVNDAPTGLVVSGTPTLSYQLNADVSALSDDDGLPDAGTFTYQWLRDGADISGATSSTYSLVDADVGEPVSVRLSYTDAQGTAEAPVSSPTIAISDSGMTPTISGDAIEGEVLTATSGLQGTLVYTWLRDGTDIANSNASSYTLVAADAGFPISVRVSTDIASIEARTSAATENVAALDALVNEFINLLSVTRTHTPSFRMDVPDRHITRGDGASLLDNLLAALKPNKSQSSEVSDLWMSKLADNELLKSSALKMVRGAMTEFMPVMDDGTGVLEGDHPDKPFYFELGYRSNADKLTVSSLGGIDKLPVYNSGTQKLNAAVVNGETVSQTGWDESIDMMLYASGNALGLKHVWFEMERDSCGILIKNNSMSSSIVRLIQNWLHKQSTSRTYTLNQPLYNESCTIALSVAYTGSVGAFVQLQHKSNDASGNEEYEAGDVIAEGQITSVNGFDITVSVTDGQFVHDTAAYNIVAGSQTLESTSVSQGSLSYNMQLYALVREDQTNVLKYMPITRDDMMNQKNDMMDGSVTALLDTSAVFSRLVNFGERAEAAGDISTPVAITDADAPLFVIRQNHFTSVGSNDQDVSESSAWGDPFVVPILD